MMHIKVSVAALAASLASAGFISPPVAQAAPKLCVSGHPGAQSTIVTVAFDDLFVDYYSDCTATVRGAATKSHPGETVLGWTTCDTSDVFDNDKQRTHFVLGRPDHDEEIPSKWVYQAVDALDLLVEADDCRRGAIFPIAAPNS